MTIARALKSSETRFLVIGVIIIILATLALKFLEVSNFERSGQALSNYFTCVNSATYLYGLLDAPWKLLLPVQISPDFMRWTTTGLIPIAALNYILGINTTFYLMNALLVAASFLISWYALRSRAFSVTLAICMGFGTQFIHAYVNTSIELLYLFVIYMEINLLAAFFLFKNLKHRALAKTAFVISLILMALCWEMWVDYAVFLVLGSVFVLIVSARNKNKGFFEQAKFILISSLCVTVGYFLVKIAYYSGVSEHFAQGRESEFVFNYLLNNHSAVYIFTVIEDMVSNLITYNYIALTNFLPPPFIFSNSLLYLGKDAIIANQYGYAASYGSAEFVYYHHVFLWYLAAGVLFAAFFYLLIKYLVSSFRNPAPHLLVLSLILILIAAGSFTHLFIKYRFYLSFPLFSYKSIVSVIGVSLLVSYLLMHLGNKMSNRKVYISVLAVVWLVIIVAGFVRPAMLSDMLNPLNMGTYPNPLSELATRLQELVN